MSKKSTFGLRAIAGIVMASLMLTTHVAQAQTFQQGGSPGGHTQVGGLTGQFAPSCAPGFIFNGERELTGSGMGGVNNYGDGWTDWYRCRTAPVKCPTQVQANGRRSSVTPRVELVKVGGDPDQSSVSFHVKYLCDYSYRSVNEK